MKSLVCGRGSSLVTTGTKYGPPWGPGGIGGSVELYYVMPCAGTFRRLWFKVSGAPGVDAGWTFTLRKYTGGAWADTALTVFIIGDAVTEALDDTNEFTVAAGDYLTIKLVVTGTPASSIIAYWGMEFEGSSAKQSILFGNFKGVNLSTTLTEYVGPGGSSIFAEADIEKSSIVIPCDGTIKNFYAQLTAAPGTGEPVKSRTFTIRKKSGGSWADTAVVVTISGTDTIGNSSTLSASVSAGDMLTIKSEVANTPAAAGVNAGLCFEAETDGDFILTFGERNQSLNRSVNNYVPIMGNNVATVTTVAAAQQLIVSDFIAKAIFVDATQVPGTGYTYLLSVNDDGTNTALQATLPQDGTAVNDTGAEAVTAGSLLAFESDPSGTAGNYIAVALAILGTMITDSGIKRMGMIL